MIFPFENDSKIASLDWLGEGLAELSFERLGEQGLNVISRQDRLAALDKVGLPASARISHATMVKVAVEADADEIVFGRFISDGKLVTLEAQVLHTSPPGLSPIHVESGSVQDLISSDSRLSLQLLCALEQRDCSRPAANAEQAGASEALLPTMAALESFVRGILATDDDQRLGALRESARLEPSWDRPPFELGQIYFAKRDCESALTWFSRVPPNRPDGPEASFDNGVCHLLRNDATRAVAAFAGLIDRAKSADPGDRLPDLSEVRNNLGVAYLRLAKWSDAAAEFERATVLDNEEPDYWVNLGITKLAAKQPAAAITPLEKARNLDPADSGIGPLVAATLQLLGRDVEAAAIPLGSAADSAAGHIPSPVPQDPAALARLARISMRFDRSLLIPAGDASPAETTRKSEVVPDRKDNGSGR